VARLGGDEFALGLPEVGDGAELARLVRRVLSELALPFEIAGHCLPAEASVGIAIYPDDGDSALTLLRNADTAMYHAKEAGRGTFQFFNAPMNERVSRRLSTETRMRRALDRGEFALHFQPLVYLADGRIAGAEALLRWPQADSSEISPAEFIPVAEDSGLIVPLGEWVLHEACMRARSWRQQGGGLRVAVNLSPRQFGQKDLVRTIEQGLQRCGLEPGGLELELTEGMLMHDADKAVHTLSELHELGVQLAIDDFGTGYSSLAYLKRFPIQKLKIDRSFIRDLNVDKGDVAIVTAIVAMARGLDLRVLAEGVETEAQARSLRTLGCEMAQGWHFGRPMPAQAFQQRLEAEHARQRQTPAAARPQGAMA
jgi:predicted signal transduction protein with EAL and GGDEF domain